jgi:hypothetical protein
VAEHKNNKFLPMMALPLALVIGWPLILTDWAQWGFRRDWNLIHDWIDDVFARMGW